jgi:hypothetical protein
MKRIVPLSPDDHSEAVCEECGAPVGYLVEFKDGTESFWCIEHVPLPTADTPSP